MDLAALKGYALALREKLETFGEDEDVAALAEELQEVLDSAIDGTLIEPLEWEDMPGGIMVDDGVFEDFEGLEDAYDDFRMEATGGEGGFDEDMDEDEDE